MLRSYVKATITTNDGDVYFRQFGNFYLLAFYLKEHHGEYTAVDARLVKEGKENDGKGENPWAT